MPFPSEFFDLSRPYDDHNRFLAALAEATERFVEPAEVMQASARMLAEHLAVDRCAYAEVENEDVFVITGDCARDVPSIVGRWPVAAFGHACVGSMLAGEPYVVTDVDADPRITAADLPAYRATTIAAVICVPLHKLGKFTASMAVHQKLPRVWTDGEIGLVRTVVGRCWEALERLRVTRTLKESEARYRAIIDATPECVKIVSPDGTLLQMNAAGLAMIEADALPVGGSVYDVIAPEFREAYREFNRRVCGGEAGTFRFDIIGLRGTRRHMETSAVPLPAPDGPHHHLAVTRDITGRTAAERVLQEHRARLDYAAQISGVGFWYCDLPFDVFIWDARVREHFWMSDDAVVTIDTFLDRLHPDDREPTRQAIDRSIRERQQYDVDYRTVDPQSGALKWIRAMGGAVYGPDGAPIRFDGVTVDVTARKVDEERLARSLAREREQARRMRMVADAALRIHSSGTLESVVQVLTEEARAILGGCAAATTLAGDETPFSVTVSVDDRARVRRTADVGPSAERLIPLAHELPRATRLTIDQLAARSTNEMLGRAAVDLPERGWLGMSLVSRGGQILGTIQVFDKIDGEFVDSDESILEQLAHTASVAIENARLYRELRDQDRRKDEFLAILAHELRNPLAPLRNGLEVLRLIDDGRSGGEKSSAGGPTSTGDTASADGATGTEVRQMMDRQLSHMVRLIDDLLDISRISRNKLQLRLDRVSLSDVIRGAVETVRPAVEAAGHQLTLSVPPEPVYLDADLTRLAQVIGNLLSNSVKYTPRGGAIRLAAVVDGGLAVISVHDTGIGIPSASLPHIFDMFSQVDRSIERSTGGMGIGLALVKGLVEMHGGTVEAASAGLGLGSTFVVRLPLFAAPTECEQPNKAGPTAAALRPKRRILIVDDNRDAALSMSMVLELMGNEVATAHDGLEAVDAADRFRPHVIIMDVGMPKLNGYDATRRIRGFAWGRDTKIFALTGWGQEVDRERSKEAGCDGHLVKPISAPDLERALAEM